MDNLKTGMNSLSRAERRDIEDFLGMSGGYVLDFSDRTFAEFFQEYNIDIDDEKYQYSSCSKANRMRSFLAQESDDIICPVLSGLMDEREYFENKNGEQADPHAERDYQKMKDVVKRLANNNNRQPSVRLPGDMHELSANYKNIVKEFNEAAEKVKTDPKTAITQANATIERIAKIIIKLERQPIRQRGASTLVTEVLKILGFMNNSKMDDNIIRAASGLITTVRNVESVRNNNTYAHGKVDDSDDPCQVRAAFVVNAAATVGYFLIEYYEKIYIPKMNNSPDKTHEVMTYEEMAREQCGDDNNKQEK